MGDGGKTWVRTFCSPSDISDEIVLIFGLTFGCFVSHWSFPLAQLKHVIGFVRLFFAFVTSNTNVGYVGKHKVNGMKGVSYILLFNVIYTMLIPICPTCAVHKLSGLDFLPASEWLVVARHGTSLPFRYRLLVAVLLG